MTMPLHGNRLLADLPATVVGRLLLRQQSVRLTPSSALVEQGQRLTHVYFPIDCSVSLLTTPSRGSGALEVALVGSEGMLGSWLLLGVDEAPLRAVVQGAGLAWRVDARSFSREVAASPASRAALNRYLYVQFAQLAQNATCTRFHVVESRLARSLLMTRDRVHSCEFHTTQQFLARMLGVRRAGVTGAASSLRRRKLIRYFRGAIEITDEEGLERAACACYQLDRETYERVIGRGR